MTLQAQTARAWRCELIVILIAAAIFLGCIVSPPSLMDDVDAVQATIARNMLTSGDWVTAHLDGVKYFEKPPLKYWLIAVFFKLFGVHDYVARLPLALLDVALCWLVYRMGKWAFGEKAGYYAGLILASCVGLFLFTRVLIADSQLTLAVAFSMWALLRALDSEENKPRAWGIGFWAAIGAGILLKGFVAAVFPIGAGFVYLLLTRQLWARETWRRLAPGWGLLALLAIAAPWHILAIMRNPPYFRFDLTSGPGQYRGFFWAWFFNEHILRFLNRRYPHDYNTVPRIWFWLFNLLWLFPASVYLPALFQLKYRGDDRASRTRLLAICWAGFVMVFFTLSSTQEYYSMPIYPAMALLLGCGIAADQQRSQKWLRTGDVALGVIWTAAVAAMIAVLARVWNLPAPGDISDALRTKTTSEYTLSLGHMGDLTLNSFAYLRRPLLLAIVAALVGAAGVFFIRRRRVLVTAIAMVIFFQAARLAMVVFDPYLSSRPLADALLHSPPGQLIVSDQYYSFSSVLFYADCNAYLLNGRINNLEYGSNAPDAPHVFIGDQDLKRMWQEPQRYYLLAEHEFLPKIEKVIGARNYTVVKESGGKYLLTNRPMQERAS